LQFYLPICYILDIKNKFVLVVPFYVHDNNFVLTLGKICNNIKSEQLFGIEIITIATRGIKTMDKYDERLLNMVDEETIDIAIEVILDFLSQLQSS
jgi:hypothetical protein